jgi:hypothetical protein
VPGRMCPEECAQINVPRSAQMSAGGREVRIFSESGYWDPTFPVSTELAFPALEGAWSPELKHLRSLRCLARWSALEGSLP